MASGIASAVIGAVGAIGSAIISDSTVNSANHYSFEAAASLAIQQELFNYWNMQLQHDYNREYLGTQYEHNKEFLQSAQDFDREMLDQQFAYNKYFTEHAHQAEVADLKAAGLNPILSANNGTTSSVGLPSSANASVGLPGAGLPSTGAHSFNAQKSEAAQLFLQGLGIGSQHLVNQAASSKMREEALTEGVRRENINADTQLLSVNKMIGQIDRDLKQKELNNYEEDRAVRIKTSLETARASIMQAEANKVSASANMMNANTRRAEHLLEQTQYNNNPYTQFRQLHPQSARWAAGLGTWTGAIGNILGGNAGVSYGIHKK